MHRQVLECGDCGKELDESPHPAAPIDRQPCPSCGSSARCFKVLAEPTIASGALRAYAKVRVKDGYRSTRKSRQVRDQGDDFHRATGRWSVLERLIDRENDRYFERIRDAETGRIIREIDEPLSKHRNRGSAKRCGPGLSDS